MISLFSPLNFALGKFEVVPETVAQIYAQFGTLHVGIDTTTKLKIYDLSPLLNKPEIVDDMLTRFQAQLVTFSHEYDPPKGIFPQIQDLKKRNYKTGHIWIYEPKVLYGSFNDAEYTKIWRVFHELAHCAVEPFLYSRYGDSRRLGQLGKISKDTWQTMNGPKEITLQPLSLRHAQRSVEWESLAFRAQRFLFAEAGVRISDDEYQREFNINMSDAILVNPHSRVQSLSYSLAAAAV